MPSSFCRARTEIPCNQRLAMAGRLRSVPARENLSEFRPEKKDLAGVVYPHDQHDDGGRGSIGRGETGLTEIKTDQKLDSREQQGRYRRAQRDVAPFNTSGRQDSVNRREKAGNDGE